MKELSNFLYKEERSVLCNLFPYGGLHTIQDFHREEKSVFKKSF
jgi:hypothetical protein